MRNVIPSADLAVSGSKVRVTLNAGASGGFVIDAAEIGHVAGAGDVYDFDGGQAALTFSGGAAGCTVALGATVLSDEITFAFDKTKDFIVAVHFSSGDVAANVYTTGTNRGYFKSAANEVSVSDVSGYTPGNIYLVKLIEVLA